MFLTMERLVTRRDVITQLITGSLPCLSSAVSFASLLATAPSSVDDGAVKWTLIVYLKKKKNLTNGRAEASKSRENER